MENISHIDRVDCPSSPATNGSEKIYALYMSAILISSK